MDEPDSIYEARRRGEMIRQERISKGKGKFPVVGFIIFCIIIWFFFFRVDYSKPWIKEGNSESAIVVWCQNENCFSGDHTYNLNVYNEGVSAYDDNKYILVVDMPNGGEIKTGVYCAKNESDIVSYKRYCEGRDNDGELWRFYPNE